jgi:hypothetical protein
MRKASTVTFKAIIATALCISFVLYPQLRVMSMTGAYAGGDLKTESEVRTEASRYEAAIKAIASIATMKLEIADELKKALAIVEREGPNLKFSRSKRIMLGLSDSTFISAVKKRSPDKAAGEALIKEVSADPRAVLKLDGAEALATRIQKSAEADAAILKRSGEALKAAAARFKQARQGGARPNVPGSDQWKLLPAGYSVVTQPNEWLMPPQGEVILGFIVAVVVVAVIVSYGYTFVKNIGTKEGRDAVAECLVAVYERMARCERAAESQPFPLNIAAEALCEAEYLVASADCLVSP